MSKKTKKRLIVFLIGMLLCMIVLEAALRIVGSRYAYMSESDTDLKSNDQNVILSIGDSVTFGIGAPKGYSYPAQLEKLFDESDPEKKYTVINRGRPGQNSTQILIRLEDWLRKIQPDIVTILIGAQNQYNYFGYNVYLEKSNNPKRGLLLNIHDGLDNIRIYKFFRLLFVKNSRTAFTQYHSKSEFISTEEMFHLSGIDGDGPGRNLVPGLYNKEIENDVSSECSVGVTDRSYENYDKVIESIMAAIDEGKDVESNCYNLIGSIYRELGQPEKAIVWLKKGVELDSGDFSNYEELGWLFFEQKKLKEAILWFEKGFEHARYITLHDQCYKGIGLCFNISQKISEAIVFFERESDRQSGVDTHMYTIANDYLLMFKNNHRERDVYNWIQADIEQILILCDQYDTKTILQNYPAEPKVSSIFKRVADQRNVLFVDHQKTFKEYINNDGTRSSEYFVPDGHPNAAGYQMMAKNIWMVLKDNVH